MPQFVVDSRAEPRQQRDQCIDVRINTGWIQPQVASKLPAHPEVVAEYATGELVVIAHAGGNTMDDTNERVRSTAQ